MTERFCSSFKESWSQFNFLLTPSYLTIQATSYSAVFNLYFLTLGIFTTKGIKIIKIIMINGTIMWRKSQQRRLKASDMQQLQYNLGLLVLCRYVIVLVIFNMYVCLVVNMHMIYMFEYVCMQMRQHELAVRLKLEPFAIHLHRTIDQLQLADTANIFGRPVTLQEVCSSALILIIIVSFVVQMKFVSYYINLYSPHGQHKTVNHKNNNIDFIS